MFYDLGTQHAVEKIRIVGEGAVRIHSHKVRQRLSVRVSLKITTPYFISSGSKDATRGSVIAAKVQDFAVRSELKKR